MSSPIARVHESQTEPSTADKKMAGFTMNPQLLECDNSSLTVAWHANAGPYELQMQSQDKNEGLWSEWKTLSATLMNNNARKKNLQNSCNYRFRVRVASGSEENEFSNPSEIMNILDETKKQMDPPELISRDNESVSLRWTAPSTDITIDGYKLRFRQL